MHFPLLFTLFMMNGSFKCFSKLCYYVPLSIKDFHFLLAQVKCVAGTRPSSLPGSLNNNNNITNGGSAGFCPETPALNEEEAALLAKLEEANR